MKFIYGLLLFLWTAAEFISNSDNNNIIGTGLILTALCLFVIKEKYLDKVLYSCIYAILAVLLSYYNPYMVILMGICLVDLSYFKKYYLLGVAAIAAIIVSSGYGEQQYLFHILLGALWGYTLRKSHDKENKHLSLLDNERALRYQLEETKLELISLQNEIERTAEVRERDRIAKEIHDNIGHSIAGVLFQLRAAEKMVSTDRYKVEQIIRLCIDKLTEALEITRKTVYNIKSDQILGIGSIHNILSNFKFCKVNFSHSGDFNAISLVNMKVIEATTKELLTNAIKHSGASEIKLQIDIKSKHLRCLYSDNGRGSDKIIESVGLSGIRNRVANLGGTYSVDGSNGFTVVYTLPNGKGA